MWLVKIKNENLKYNLSTNHCHRNPRCEIDFDWHKENQPGNEDNVPSYIQIILCTHFSMFPAQSHHEEKLAHLHSTRAHLVSGKSQKL